jgi:hypothetical protein
VPDNINQAMRPRLAFPPRDRTISAQFYQGKISDGYRSARLLCAIVLPKFLDRFGDDREHVTR